MTYIPNDERMLVLPIFTLDDEEEGRFKSVRVRADEVIGYFPHKHEFSYGEDHVYIIEGTTIQFKTFEAKCSPLAIDEMDLFFNEAFFLEQRVSDQMDCRGQDLIFEKIREIKEQCEKKNVESSAEDAELPGMWERADFIDNSEEGLENDS